MTEGTTTLDGKVIVIGALYGLCWVVPATIANAAAAASDVGALVLLCFLVILLGFGFAGYAAARQPLAAPLQHAAAAGFLTFAVVQGVLALIRVARGDAPSLVGIAFNALLAACTGMLGGLLAVRASKVAR